MESAIPELPRAPRAEEYLMHSPGQVTGTLLSQLKLTHTRTQLHFSPFVSSDSAFRAFPFCPATSLPAKHTARRSRCALASHGLQVLLPGLTGVLLQPLSCGIFLQCFRASVSTKKPRGSWSMCHGKEGEGA